MRRWHASSSSEALSSSPGTPPVQLALLAPAEMAAGPAGPTGNDAGDAAPEPGLEPAPTRREPRRLRLLVAYLGTPFHGFALQPGLRTVASELTGALEKLAGHPVQLTCAGRTDAGVHAWGQVVSLDVTSDLDLGRLQRSLNKMLGPEVVVREAGWAAAGFDARRSALSRRYRYQVSCARWPDPLAAPTVWHLGAALDLRAMQAGSDPLLGEHDFSSFCHAVRDRPGPLVRRVLAADWHDIGNEQLRFEIEATSFCHQMVRSIVGTLVEVGLGRRRAGDVLGILRARDRASAGPVAPARGLCLWEVTYPPA